MKKNLYKYLAGNEYPGRGIVLGLTPDSKKAVVAYWIMGRSANSRNRVFEPIEGGIRTVAADPAKLEDPHLIIYNAVLTLRETTVVTNGDQTDTIARFMNGNLFPGYSFEAALATRTYEDDAPNFTPRISGVVDMRRGGYKLSIVKSNEGNAASVQRYTFDYPQPVAGEGHFISTYQKNGAPIPSFAGEPLHVAIDENDPDKFADKLWKNLNEDNKVSLFVRSIELETGTYEDIILNKYAVVQGQNQLMSAATRHHPQPEARTHLHGRRLRPAGADPERPPGLHQLSGCVQLLAAGARPEKGPGPARRRQLQACVPRRCGHRPAAG